MNFFSNIISGVTNFFTPQAPSAPPVSSFSNPVVTESVARVRDFVAPMLEKPTFSFTYQPSNVGANRVYSAATAKAPAAPTPRYDEYVAPSIGPAKRYDAASAAGRAYLSPNNVPYEGDQIYAAAPWYRSSVGWTADEAVRVSEQSTIGVISEMVDEAAKVYLMAGMGSPIAGGPGAVGLSGNAVVDSVKSTAGRVAHNLVPPRTYNLMNDWKTLRRTGFRGVASNIKKGLGVSRDWISSPARRGGDLALGQFMRPGVSKDNIYRDPLARLMWNQPPKGTGLAEFYARNADGTLSLTSKNPARLSVLNSLILEGGAYGGRDPHVMGAFFSKATPKGVQYFDNFGIELNPGEWGQLLGKVPTDAGTRIELAARAVASKFTSPPTVKGVIPWSEVNDYLNYVSSCKPGYFDSAALQALQRTAQEGALRELGPSYMMQRARSSPPVWEAFEGGFTLPPWR